MPYHLTSSVNQDQIRKWLGHFFLFNLLIVYVVSFQYFDHVFPIKLYFWTENSVYDRVIVQYFMTLNLIGTYIGYFSLLTLTSLVPAFLLSLFSKKNPITITIAILGIASLLFILIIDIKVFTLYRFHLNKMVFQFLFNSKQQATFFFSSAEWNMFYLIIASILLIEIILALFLWFKAKFILTRWVKLISYISIGLLLISIHSIIKGNKYFLYQSNIFPYFNELITRLINTSSEKMNRYTSSSLFLKPKYPLHSLQYPLHPVQCQKKSNPKNIFIILIDTWRFDALNPEVSPNLNAFAAENLQFHHHISGGNSTQPGVFSLFYGLPGFYWTSILKQGKSPELIHQLIQQNYQFSILASSNLKLPDFESTIFNLLPKTQAQTEKYAWEQDTAITQKMLSFLSSKKHSNPIFSFIFYQSVHEFCEEKNDKDSIYPELEQCERYKLNNNYDRTLFFNRYLNRVHFVDQQIAQVLQGIKKAGLWDDSIIIISADHGEEFNDNHQNYWGHASNFTKYQVNVPLLIHWPGHENQNFYHTTTHYDIAPTLIKEALNCPSPMIDYSDGVSLFSKKNRYPVIVSNHYNAGYLTPDRITSLFLSGDIEIRNTHGELMPAQKPDNKQFEYFLHKLHRFYLK